MISLTVLCFAVTPVSASLSETLTDIQEAYRSGGDLSADFQQVHVEKLRGKRRQENGRLWAKPDGRLRWQYLAPERKDFYFNGSNAYFYEPAKTQVTVFQNFGDSPFSHALGFLIGQGDIAQSFDIEACKKHCDLITVDGVAIDLWPKKPLAAIDHILVFADTRKKRIVMSVIFDSLGNRTEYRFDKLEFHAKHPDKRFEFHKPKGVQEKRLNLATPAEPARP